MSQLLTIIATIAICVAAPAIAQEPDALATDAQALEREDYAEAKKWYQVAADGDDE